MLINLSFIRLFFSSGSNFSSSFLTSKFVINDGVVVESTARNFSILFLEDDSKKLSGLKISFKNSLKNKKYKYEKNNREKPLSHSEFPIERRSTRIIATVAITIFFL